MGAQRASLRTNADFPGSRRPELRHCSSTRCCSAPGSGSNPMNNFDATRRLPQVSYELANMEIRNLLNGRPQLAAGTPPTVTGSSFVGRWGENVTRLDPMSPPSWREAPERRRQRGERSVPAAGNVWRRRQQQPARKGTFTDAQGVFHPAFVQPIDFFAGGIGSRARRGSCDNCCRAPHDRSPGERTVSRLLAVLYCSDCRRAERIQRGSFRG